MKWKTELDRLMKPSQMLELMNLGFDLILDEDAPKFEFSGLFKGGHVIQLEFCSDGAITWLISDPFGGSIGSNASSFEEAMSKIEHLIEAEVHYD